MRFLLADLSDRILRFLSVHTLQQHAGFVGTLNFYKYPPCVMWGTLACQLLQIVSRPIHDPFSVSSVCSLTLI